MHSGNIEVVHIVRQVVAIAEDPASRAHRKMKRQAALILIAPRMHPRLHHAFADLIAVQKLRQMANRIVHIVLARLTLPAQLEWNSPHTARKSCREWRGTAFEYLADTQPHPLAGSHPRCRS